MAVKDPTSVANKWSQRLAASTQSITDGVNGVTTAPGQKAAAQADVWLANLQAARDKWVRNVSAVSLSSWQQAMLTKGVPRISGGATAAVPKMTQFMQQWLPYADSIAQSLPPRGTIDQNIARATAQIRGNAAFVKKPYTGI